MSLDTWKEEFFPIPANETSKEDALKHSLAKWVGLQKVNLEKHGLKKIYNYAIGESFADETFHTTSENCALCHHYDCADHTDLSLRGKPKPVCPLNTCDYEWLIWTREQENGEPIRDDPAAAMLRKIQYVMEDQHSGDTPCL